MNPSTSVSLPSATAGASSASVVAIQTVPCRGDDVALGAEWREKPDHLSAFREQAAHDVFVAWYPSRHFSATLTWLNLGTVANKPSQRGWYLSVQAAL